MDPVANPRRRANQHLWDVWAERHASIPNPIYDLDAFRAGACTLDPIETEEVGEVAGKRLIHLQCHFGLDTLSWARRGALATGVDISSRAIAIAQRLAAETGLAAHFVASDLFALPATLDGAFDVVFTSAGVLCWLDDLPAWGRIVARLLAPGGIFYLREFHPFATLFDNEPTGDPPRLRYPYFGDGTPLHFHNDCSYAVGAVPEPTDSYEWPHTLADIVNALLAAGLRLEFLHEFAHCGYPMLPFLREEAPGRWVHPANPRALPLQFSLRANRP